MLRYKMLFNHRENESYMQEMCHQGWAATSYLEGLWFFDACEPDAYVYRMCYLRGQTFQETEDLKKAWAAQGIEFVSRYTYWGILRSTEDFEIYSPEEELEISKRISQPFTGGILASAVVTLGALFFTLTQSPWYIFLALLAGAYCGLCIGYSSSYKKLIEQLERELS